MTPEALRRWLSEPRVELIEAVARCVRDHVAVLRSRGIEFYGYALLPGEPYDIRSLVAVTNAEADIKAGRDDEEYSYYRFSVDEWANWEHDAFTPANALLVEANERFAALHHPRHEGGYEMDEIEIAHSESLLGAVVQGLEAAKAGGSFAGAEPFLVVWISDTDHTIMAESVRRLNSKRVARQFLAEFG